MKEFYQSNPPAVDVFGTVNGLLIIGAVTFIIGLIGWIVKR